jgi:hypothetical protein
MKKLLYIFLILFSSGIAITSCTEEEIAPMDKLEDNGGGGVTDPKNT